MSTFAEVFTRFGVIASSSKLQSSWSIALLALVTATGYYVLAQQSRKRARQGLPLPPGPKGVPIFGNLFQIPKIEPWLTYKDWSKEYGEVTYLEAMGQPIIILNSLSAILELLENRSVNTSTRFPVPAFEIMDIDWIFGVMDYGPDWRAHRKLFHQLLNSNEVPNYRPVIEQETNKFLRKLSLNPDGFLEETKELFASLIMRVSYGVDDDVYNKEIIQDAEVVLQGFSEAALPGSFMVNVFPIMRYIPSWFPGAAWKKRLVDVVEVSKRVRTKPWNNAKARANKGLSNDEYPNMVKRLIEDLPDEDDPEYREREIIAQNSIGTAYVAGSDTTVSTGHALFLMLAMYPEVLRRAQQEIDTVVGAYRLPTASDIDKLVYLKALIKELTRLHSVAPLGFKNSKEDDVYNGYFIPKGSIFIPNSWSVMHDPEMFEDPMTFKPERYLPSEKWGGKINPNIIDPDVAAFGYGRRKCPGRFLSNEAVTFMAAGLIAAFDITPSVDKQGNKIPLKLEVCSDLVCAPLPFKCDVRPRSERHAALLAMQL
ncbi:O-methylsterigmatocystin oxidoreductase [Coprinopsis marcescibilis]|uniref:O-methylsterigmatocystin oxidoreductase n=1 Tax=Coprinopsis marcescibilis TaxID=230819 RepID=A0A5C3KPZ1_COPMA|nr:O-methylsterigmatocystin oxidoreductase [Coprinopsis marcescibilis]